MDCSGYRRNWKYRAGTGTGYCKVTVKQNGLIIRLMHLKSTPVACGTHHRLDRAEISL